MGHEKNWERRLLWSQGDKFRIDVNNPNVGGNGPSVYTMYGVSDENDVSLIGMTQGGTLRLWNDRCIEVIAGANQESDGVDIVLSSLSGDITITANRNGAVKIKGKNIVLDADEDITLKSGRNIVLDSKQRVLLKGTRCDAKGLYGSLIPDGGQFGVRVFEGSFVGTDGLLSGVFGDKLSGIVGGAFGGMLPFMRNGGFIGSTVLGTAFDMAGAAASGALSGGVGSLVSGAAQLASSNLAKGLSIDSVPNFATHALQSDLDRGLALDSFIIKPASTVNNSVPDDIGAELDAELERAKAGDRTGLGDALDIS